MIDTILFWTVLSVAQAANLAPSTPDQVPSVTVATVDDSVGGPPTAPTLSTKIRTADPADVLVPLLLAIGASGVGYVIGFAAGKKEVAK